MPLDLELAGGGGGKRPPPGLNPQTRVGLVFWLALSPTRRVLKFNFIFSPSLILKSIGGLAAADSLFNSASFSCFTCLKNNKKLLLI